MIRPCGLAPGAIALVAAWFAALMIALLTGAPAVVVLLVAGAVGVILAVAGGGLVVRRVVVHGVATHGLATVGDDLRWHVSVRGGQMPVMIELRIDAETVASGIVTAGENVLDGYAPARGVHTAIEARWTSGGRAGLVIWRRRAILSISPLSVAPAIGSRGADVSRLASAESLGAAASPRSGHDQPDGVRPWRDGDEVGSVHWPSSLRSRELIMRQQLRDVDEQWIVQARTGTGDADAEAARVRRSLEVGLTQHALVGVRVDGGDAQWLEGRTDVVRWCADFEASTQRSRRPPWWRRTIRISAGEPDTRLSTRSRWLVALASAGPLAMLLGPLGYGTPHVAIVLVALAIAAAVTSWTGSRYRNVRQLAGLLSAMLVTGALIDTAEITSVATSLRFLLPQVLVGLVVLQGFECSERRAARVSLGCSAFLIAYTAGVRVDAQLGPWLLFVSACWVFALVNITRPDRARTAGSSAEPGTARRAVAGNVAWFVAAATAVGAILAVVPIPRGPAQLTLPSWLEERRPTAGDGALAAPDGSPLLGGGSGARGSGGTGGQSAGSYAGFSPEMDTSLRGDLGEEVVLRVRSPYPDYWRGQTYTYFDGRSWTTDDERGFRTEGPDHRIGPARGDVVGASEELIQTFYPQVDLPNLIFAATSARRVLLDAPLWQRPDGAMRADVVLPAGSAYTVVSERSIPTADLLRLDGDIAVYGSPPEYVQLPESTTERVRRLATELSAGSASTFDTVLNIEQWLNEHVAYDLDAPVPRDGVDAVDDFLFESQRGFCEQIATATAVMLRSLGVPARVATGFVPSDRDEIAGVWISRASDAHAWVEVRFPTFGWVAFDPTASVPLAGDARESTIGGELAAAVGELVSANVGPLIAVVLASAFMIITARLVRRWLERRRRGRWGLLQDRFVAAAIRHGAQPTDSNTQLAAAFETRAADAIAQTLDASAFAGSWVDDDELFEDVASALQQLEAAGRRP